MLPDCDDVMLLLAGERTLTGKEEAGVTSHLATCEACRELAFDTQQDKDWRWVARLPDDAFDDPDALVLPTVDPIVFSGEVEIASGGMGKITRARDRRLGREVAIKEMLDLDLRARFEREATITARLQHPAIVPIYEAGAWPDGGAFYTMRLVSGGTLASAIEKCETLADRLKLLPHVVAVTEALAYAHSQRVIHRDLKPQNILVGEFGETVVIDWGLAKELDRPDLETTIPDPRRNSTDLTLAGSVVGTPCFMSPEQAEGGAIDERADVFALGAILYNVLRGTPPYWKKGATTEALIAAVITRDPDPLEDDIPEDLVAIVTRAMQRSLATRYTTAKEMAEELRRFQGGQLLRSRQYGIGELLWRWILRHKAPVVVGLVAAMTLAVVGVIALRNITRSRDAAREAQAQTEISIASLLEEQGRSELVAGHRDRALAYLAQAYVQGRDTPALRHMLASATRDQDLLVGTIPGEAMRALAFLADGRLAIWSGLGEDSMLTLVSHGAIEKKFPVGDVTEGRFSPDGRRFVGITLQQPANGWDVTSGTKLWTLPGDWNDLDFSPDGRQVAIYPDHAGASVVDLETGAVLLAIPAKYQVSHVAFDASSKVLVAIGDSPDAGFFSVQDKGYQEIPFEKIGQGWSDAAFVDSGLNERVAMTTNEREVMLWTLEPPLPFHAIGGHRAGITVLASSVPHKLFATADEAGDVKLWNRNGKLLGEAHDADLAIRQLVFSHDQTLLVGVGDGPVAYVWNDTLGLRGELVAPGDELTSLHAVAIAKDDSLIATVDEAGDHVRLWKPPVASFIGHYAGNEIAVEGDHLVVANGSHLTLIDLVSGKATKTIDVPSESFGKSAAAIDQRRPAVMLVGNHALTFNPTGATLFDLVTGTLTRVLGAQGADWQLTRSYLLEVGDEKVVVHSIATGKVVLSRDVDPGGLQTGCEISPDESKLVVTGEHQRAWSLPAGIELPRPQLALRTNKSTTTEEITEDVRWAPNGQRAVISGVSAPFLVDADGKTIARLDLAAPDDVIVRTVRYSPDSAYVVTEIHDSAAVWSTATGKLLFTVADAAPRAVAMTNDRVAVGSHEGAVRIYDLTGRLLETIKGNRTAITNLAFTATRLVAVDGSHDVTIWDTHLEQRSPAEIKALADRTPWRVVAGALQRK